MIVVMVMSANSDCCDGNERNTDCDIATETERQREREEGEHREDERTSP
jgi:hypothetical protein